MRVHLYSGRKFGKYPHNTRPMESTPLLQPKSGIQNVAMVLTIYIYKDWKFQKMYNAFL